MRALVLLAAVAVAPAPKPPTLVQGCPAFTSTVSKLIEATPAIYADAENNAAEPGRVLLADGTAEYTFTSVSECAEPFPAQEPESPDVFAPPPPVDPDFDEFDPDGPQPGPDGAPTVDRP